MLPTPHLPSTIDFQRVYEPAEDTFLMLDALEKDKDLLMAKKPTIILEIGSGSGCALTFLAQLLKNEGGSSFDSHAIVFIGTDINEYAAKVTLQTAKHNQVHVDSIRTRFTASLQLKGKVDVLLFNPPYVVTPEEELGSTGIEAAWAGGIDGRQVLDEFLCQVKDLLSPKGLFYLVTIKENKPAELMDYMKQVYQLNSEIVLSRKAGCEGLSILKFYI